MTTTNNYYNWLIRKIKCREVPVQAYGFLLSELFYTKFYWPDYIPEDENRASDGIFLRQNYLQEYPNDYEAVSHLDGDCSLLEMMVALACRCEDEYLGDPLMENTSYKWFWAMVENLDLMDQTNSNFDIGYVRYVILACLNRDYGPDGVGSLWPSNYGFDVGRIEIWRQMNVWIMDKFPDYGY